MKRLVPLAVAIAAICAFAPTIATAKPAGATEHLTLPVEDQGGWPYGIATGPDGNVWFTNYNKNFIGRFTPAGVYKKFPLATGTNPYAITAGPDGNVWFSQFGDQRIGRLTPEGDYTSFPTIDNHEPAIIVTGPDGNLWYTSNDGVIGRMTPAGEPFEWDMPGASAFMLAPGGDGNLWYATSSAAIGRITPAGTFLGEFPQGGQIDAIATGPDGNIWFTKLDNTIAYITPSGTVTPFTPIIEFNPQEIVAGPDGNLWFTNNTDPDLVGRITVDGTTTAFPYSDQLNVAQYAMTAGPDGNIWVADTGGAATSIGVVGTGMGDPAASAKPLLSGPHIAGSAETCSASAGDAWLGAFPSLEPFAWQRDGAKIAGASGPVYTPTSEDVGRTLTCSTKGSYAFPRVTFSSVSEGMTIAAPAVVPAAKTNLVTCNTRKKRGKSVTTCKRSAVAATTKFKKSRKVKVARGTLTRGRAKLKVSVELRGKRTRLLTATLPKRGTWKLKVGRRTTVLKIK